MLLLFTTSRCAIGSAPRHPSHFLLSEPVVGDQTNPHAVRNLAIILKTLLIQAAVVAGDSNLLESLLARWTLKI